MAWTGQTFSVGQILTAAQMNNLQADITAHANGDSSAPKNQTASYATGSVDGPALNAEVGAWIEIDSASIGSNLNVTLTGMDGTYDAYMVLGWDVQRSGSTGSLAARFTVGGTPQAGSQFTVGTLTNTTTKSLVFAMSIIDPSNTGVHKMAWFDGYDGLAGARVSGSTLWASTSAIDGIQFIIVSAGPAQGGEFRLYGLKT